MLFYLVIIDFIFLVYLYICMQWLGLSVEQTLATNIGTLLFVSSAFFLGKKLLAKPRKIGRTLFALGMIMFLLSYAISLRVREPESIMMVEDEQIQHKSGISQVYEVITSDTPGIIRNDVTARVMYSDSRRTEERKIKIEPRKQSDGRYWRVVRFGYAPMLTIFQDNNIFAQQEPFILASEIWDNNLEMRLVKAGIKRSPPPRIMLGVGAFPPEMEGVLDLNRIGVIGKDKPNVSIFFRLSSGTANGKPVALDGDDYHRFLTQGRLLNPVFRVSLIENDRSTITKNLKPGETFSWKDGNLKLENMKYWVELESRKDGALIFIIFGLGITYLGLIISAISYIKSKLKISRFVS